LKAGAIDSEMTMIIGYGEPVIMVNAFQNTKGAVIRRRVNSNKERISLGTFHFDIMIVAKWM